MGQCHITTFCTCFRLELLLSDITMRQYHMTTFCSCSPVAFWHRNAWMSHNGLMYLLSFSTAAYGCYIKNTCHFLLHCPNFVTERNTLLNKISNIDSNFLNQAAATITKTLGNPKYSNEINLQNLNASIDFTLTFIRFDEPLLNC